MAMKNQKPLSKVFNIENCLTTMHAPEDLFDCLAAEQAHLCGNSLSFGNGYFCKHPRRKEFSKRDMQPPDSSEPDHQK
jgi:hypothetical protein